jgi:hypothetical protein
MSSCPMTTFADIKKPLAGWQEAGPSPEGSSSPPC